jgi:hypothetical protein
MRMIVAASVCSVPCSLYTVRPFTTAPDCTWLQQLYGEQQRAAMAADKREVQQQLQQRIQNANVRITALQTQLQHSPQQVTIIDGEGMFCAPLLNLLTLLPNLRTESRSDRQSSVNLRLIGVVVGQQQQSSINGSRR